MKHGRLWFFLFLFFSLQSFATSSPVGTLVLHVTNFKDNKGTVRIALARSKAELDFVKKPYKLAETKINDKQAKWVFHDLPYGEYAIKLYHDENGNKVFDTNFLGIPEEGYGFSNNAKGHFGPPDYKQVKFSINKITTDMTIKIVN